MYPVYYNITIMADNYILSAINNNTMVALPILLCTALLDQKERQLKQHVILKKQFCQVHSCEVHTHTLLHGFQTTPSFLLKGATTLVHSGRKSVVGNSKVEEHISRQAIADVLQLQQHSQDPANITEHRLEVCCHEAYSTYLYMISLLCTHGVDTIICLRYLLNLYSLNTKNTNTYVYQSLIL